MNLNDRMEKYIILKFYWNLHSNNKHFKAYQHFDQLNVFFCPAINATIIYFKNGQEICLIS
jgi:hypothetical protein